MKLKYLLLTLATLAFFFKAQAQVKIGANPSAIGTSSSLEVEATNGNKTMVNKTNGQITIQDGTQGAGKVLTSDANGVASWMGGATTSIVNGTVPAPTGWPNLTQPNVSVNSGASITLPAGKWLVFWRSTFRNQTNNDAQIFWDLMAPGGILVGRALSSMGSPNWYCPVTAIYDVQPTTTTTYTMYGMAGVGVAFTAGYLYYTGEGRLFAIPVAN